MSVDRPVSDVVQRQGVHRLLESRLHIPFKHLTGGLGRKLSRRVSKEHDTTGFADGPFELRYQHEAVDVPYEYKPLDKDRKEIRLLDLAPGRRSDPLRGSLRTVSLNDDPTFDALSYLWGDPRDRTSVDLGKHHQLSIHRNLSHALLDLRSRWKTITLWTDGICIDQSNLFEKNHQVALMAQLYRRARVVRAWLDVQVDADADAFKTVQKLGRSRSVEDYSEEFWYPVASVFLDPYWDRLWVQQELMLAHRIIVHCRQSVFRAEGFLHFQAVVFHDSYNGSDYPIAARIWKRFGEKNVFMNGIAHGRHYLSANSQHIVQDIAYNVLDLFLESSHLHCTERHDRVYGLLGILADVEVEDVVVDYQLPLAEVYAQLIAKFLHKYQTLAFLCYQSVEVNVSDIPSWLPAPENTSFISWSDVDVSSASHGSSVSQARIHNHDLTLTVQGLLIDRVCLFTPGKRLGEIPLSEMFNLLEEYCHRTWPLVKGQSIWLENDILKLIFPPFDQQTCRTLIGRDMLGPEEQRSAMTEIVQAREILSLTLCEIWNDARKVSSISTTGSHALQLMACSLMPAELISTVSNRLGVARALDLQPKDEIWILFGCPMPIVLRPRPDQQGGYTRIGCARIPGLMNGEACEGISENGDPEPGYDGPPVQEITLW